MKLLEMGGYFGTYVCAPWGMKSQKERHIDEVAYGEEGKKKKCDRMRNGAEKRFWKMRANESNRKNVQIWW